MPDGFLRQRDAVAFVQLLARECRPEVGVAFTDDRHRPHSQSFIQFPVARAIASARAQTGGTRSPIADHQPLNLAHAQPDPFSSPPGFQPQLRNRLNHL